MFIKLTRCCAIVWIAFGFLNLTLGGAPPGLREALGEFETGATHPTPGSADRMVGRQKEISRYQILPTVWRQYSRSRNYHDPDASWFVASKILQDREKLFRNATGRHWDYIDVYVLWNAPGHYRHVNWNRTRISPVIMERAQRFANLMQVRARQYASN